MKRNLTCFFFYINFFYFCCRLEIIRPLRYGGIRQCGTSTPLRTLQTISNPLRNWGIQIVPDNQVFIVERNGVYLKNLPCGIHLTNPCVDKIAHIHCLNEKKYFIVWQSELTSDDKFFNFNTEFSLQIKEPELVTYGKTDSIEELIELARLKVREEIRLSSMESVGEKNDLTRLEISKTIILHVNEEAKTKGLGAVMLRHKIVPRFKKKEISNKARKRQERPKRNSQKSYTSLIIKSQDEIKSSLAVEIFCRIKGKDPKLPS